MTTVIKKFGIDFNSEGGALTLPSSAVAGDDYCHGPDFESELQTKTHDSGWTISGCVREDYFLWVNDFKATHPDLGTVEGNFEEEVTASSEEAFQHFWAHHEPQAWDYGDI